MESYTPSAVVTGFVVRGLWEYYNIHNSEEVKEVIISASQFIREDLPHTKFENGICISYTPVQKDLCYNASLLGAEVLARAGKLNNDLSLIEDAIRAVEWVIERQKPDGKWNYSINDKGEEREQIDFHQGYVIESIFEIKSILSINKESWERAIKKGLEFYRKHQFFDNGQSLWRLPKKYPVDIHNQAQGIITFSKLSEYNTDIQLFAQKITDYTIDNMQDKRGFFYYKKHKYFRNKIPFMRWSQAWMFLAFSYIK